MDGICEVVPVPNDDVRLEIDGHVYILQPLTVEDWSAITAEVKKLRPDPIAVALRMVAGLESREEKVQVLQWAWSEARRAHVVPEHEVAAWGTTPEGATFALWRSLRHREPDLSLDVVRAWCRPLADRGIALGTQQICELVQRVHELPPTGPT